MKVQLQPLDNSSKCQWQREWWRKHDRVHFISIIPVRGDSCSCQSRNLYFASENQEHRLNPCKGFSLLTILLQLCFRHSKNVFLSSDYTYYPSVCTLLPLDQVKFLCIFGICGCSQPTSHCRALKTSPASFQPRFILLNSGNAEQGDGLIKNQGIGSIFLVRQDRYSCLGNLHSLHK